MKVVAYKRKEERNVRYKVTIQTSKREIPKDKNRIILSLIKHQLSQSDTELFDDWYRTGKAKEKDFCFALYMKDCIFHRETIEIPNREIIITFSVYDLVEGIRIYNSFIRGIGNDYSYRDEITLTIKSVNLLNEKNIINDKVVFQCQSPCVAREHAHDNSKTWYHSLSDEKGKQQFLENLKLQASLKFPEKMEDIDKLQLKVLKNKKVKVKHYDIVIDGNLALFELRGKPYLLEYFYKAGAGSLKSGGFGLLRKVDEVK